MKEKFLEVVESLGDEVSWGSDETVKVFYNPNSKALRDPDAYGVTYRGKSTGALNIVLGKMNIKGRKFRSIVAEEIFHASEYTRGVLYQGMNQTVAWMGEVGAQDIVLAHRGQINISIRRVKELQGYRDDYQACVGGASNSTCGR